MEILFALALMSSLVLAAKALSTQQLDRLTWQAGFPDAKDLRLPALMSRLGAEVGPPRSVLPLGLGVALAWVGAQLAGPPGAVAGGVAGGALLPMVRRRNARRRADLLEGQLAELADTTALAVRSGLSVTQAVDFAAQESQPPMRDAVIGLITGRRLGTAFEDAVERFGEAIATDDARLFAVILGVQARAGGNLAGALDEVTATIRHRIALRKELRALSAQGRISGVILAALPIAFALVLGATSREELAPVYRSPAGFTMVAGGLVMEGLAFLWIRRLLRVDV